MPPISKETTEKRGVGRPPSAAVRSREAIATIANPPPEVNLQSSTSPAPQPPRSVPPGPATQNTPSEDRERQRLARANAVDYWEAENADWETHPPGSYTDYENRHSFPDPAPLLQYPLSAPNAQPITDRPRVATVQRSSTERTSTERAATERSSTERAATERSSTDQTTSRVTPIRSTPAPAPRTPSTTVQSSSRSAAAALEAQIQVWGQSSSHTPNPASTQAPVQAPIQVQNQIPNQTPNDLWALVSSLAQSVSATSNSVNALRQTVEGIQQANLAPSDVASVTTESHAEPKSILTPKMDLMRIFKVPSATSPPQEIEHTLMSWKLRFELPLKQERNRQEVRAIFRAIGVLMSGVLSDSVREAIVVCLSRCEELTLLETHGSSYATTWAHQIFLRADDSQVLASAHAAALMAAGKSLASESRNRSGSSRRPSKRK